MRDDYWWGRIPPDEATVAWGARAIAHGKGFSMLSDRQSWRGSKEQIERTAPMIDRHVLPVLQDRRYNGASEEVYAGEQETPIGVLKFEASTQMSYGYVYVVVWLENGHA